MNKKALLDEFRHCKDEKGKVSKMVTAVLLPSGATEIIINTEDLEGKINYYSNAYDDDMKLKANNQIQIVDWIIL